MKKVFEFVALTRKGNIQGKQFLHDRNLRGKKINLLDRVYLKNDKPRVGVSKKLKFRFDGIYTDSRIQIRRRGNEALQNKARRKGTVQDSERSKVEKSHRTSLRQKS